MNIRMESEIIDKISIRARKDRRTLSGEIRYLIDLGLSLEESEQARDLAANMIEAAR
jgi:macrodomain Ter protein organizer (MatP/YcbG family)